MAHEQKLIEQWLYEQLHGDAALLAAAPGDVHTDGIAPAGTLYPYVTFQFQAGSDLMYNSGRRVWADTLWLIKVTVKAADDEGLGDALDRIDEVLHLASGPVGVDGRVASCHREGMFSQPTVEGGVHYRQQGGFYRIRIKQPATV